MSDILSTVKTIFQDKARCGELFTSVDVTKPAGQRHRHIREALHKLWSNGDITALGYTRTLALMSDGVSQAYVYGPVGVDAKNYTNRSQTLDPRTSGSGHTQYAPPAPTIIDNPPTKRVKQKHLTRKLRADGAVEIPGSVIDQLQPNTAQNLYAWWCTDRNSIIVSKTQPSKPSRKFKIYSTGETRVPAGLVHEHLRGKQQFSIRASTKEVRVF